MTRPSVCRVCGASGDFEAYLASEKMYGLGGEFPYFACERCGCLQIAEIPADLAPYYPADYYSLRPLSVPSRAGIKEAALRWRWRSYRSGLHLEPLWRALISRYDFMPWLRRLDARTDESILDVGAGNGSFLRDLYRLGFTDLSGIDPFLDQDRELAPGFRVLKRELGQMQGSFDIITAHHSLEHMPDQAEALEQLRRLLAPGGRLLIRIPVVPSLAWERYGVDWVGLDAPRHLYLHSTHSLGLLAQKAGLEPYHLEYDSGDLQFWGSEQYKMGIPLHAPNSWAVSRKNSVFNRGQIMRFRRWSKALNRQGRGDAAVFYFKAKA